MKHLKNLTTLILLICSISANAQMARLYTSESGLANSQINMIYQDKSGFIWISTENGLSRFDGMNFSTFRFDRNRQTSIASNMVLATYEDSDNNFWVGTSAGLQIFNSEYNTFTKVPLNDEGVPGSDQHISTISEIETGGARKILVTTSGYGVYILDGKTHGNDKDIQSSINSALPSNFIYKAFVDSKERLWMSMEDGGLVVYDLKKGERISAIWEKGMKEAENDLFNAFIEDNETGNIFIGSFNHGILIMTLRKAI
jgi:ligand-binding sensor domain-containing protein